MMRGFTIERDLISEPYDPTRVGYTADKWASGDLMPEGPTTKFRLYDDDGNLYYEGIFGDDPYSIVQMDGVLNFGAYDAGCTTIKVKRGRKWVQEIG